MIGAAIGLVMGLFMFFFGMTMLNLEKQDRKKAAEMAAAAKQEAESATTANQAQEDSGDDGVEEEPTKVEEEPKATPSARSIRRIKMGIQLLAQGFLLLVVGIAFIFLHFYWKPMAEYITIPVVVVLAIIALVFDFYTMGASIDKEAKDKAKAAECEQEVQDCTEKSSETEQQMTQGEDDE